MQPSPIIKRSVVCNGHKTSVSLEKEFWAIFHDMARARNMTLGKLFEEFDNSCPENSSMSSHIRTSILAAVIKRAKAA
jgi:predicted DNA-binding ribbon-helix-helix protein